MGVCAHEGRCSCTPDLLKLELQGVVRPIIGTRTEVLCKSFSMNWLLSHLSSSSFLLFVCFGCRFCFDVVDSDTFHIIVHVQGIFRIDASIYTADVLII